MKDMLAFYRRHSAITDPGPYAEQLRSLPTEIDVLVDIVGGIWAHFERDVIDVGLHLPAGRRHEIDLRFVRTMLDRVVELDDSPLEVPRPLFQRCMGTCRDACVLLAGILRAQGVPARSRYGFTPFMMKKDKPLHDHVLVEYWSEPEQKWKLCDARLNRPYQQQHNIHGVDPTDIPVENFVSGSQAWLMSRQSEQDALKLSGLKFNAAYGMWKARNLCMYDLASLSGTEPMLWDAWGYILLNKPWARPRGYFQSQQLSRLARLDPGDPLQWRELLRLYRTCRHIRLGRHVKACSHINGDHFVTLTPKDAGAYAVH